MYNVRENIQARIGNFRMDHYWFWYSNFIPRLHNWLLDLGFETGKIMPSRAFCSDESQGYPIILLAKHFGVFPFNHGQVGGIMACERHGPHAHHGKDLFILHASHVGYDPITKVYGTYRRIQSEHSQCSSNCGKIHGVLDWYLKEYEFAKNHIFVDMHAKRCLITIDNQFLSRTRELSLMLNLEKMIEMHSEGEYIPISIQSTSRTFQATQDFFDHMNWFFDINSGPQAIGDSLLPEYFSYTYQTDLVGGFDSMQQIEKNLMRAMPWIVTSSNPMLTSAQVNTEAEFDRAFRSVSQDPAYAGRNLVYISGLNIDISPEEDQDYVLTKFIPWAAYVQLSSGERYILEQQELFDKLKSYSLENETQVQLDLVIEHMSQAEPIDLNL
ncbi:MAG: Unknown protein [uncultured Thiotrichaceae bacterium]|uniref:Limiting CO2-inducible protein B/C beta carbonyic anhydrase domain-containing protein n=1 Tax=uncultured Thiotrichaceae bacterium TaxID=298394 RepID=A0A6S6TJA6_9GAMM|nr:MAG: Unknown protein [uncultured Thiotrichaceae bacterium]